MCSFICPCRTQSPPPPVLCVSSVSMTNKPIMKHFQPAEPFLLLQCLGQAAQRCPLKSKSVSQGRPGDLQAPCPAPHPGASADADLPRQGWKAETQKGFRGRPGTPGSCIRWRAGLQQADAQIVVRGPWRAELNVKLCVAAFAQSLFCFELSRCSSGSQRKMLFGRRPPVLEEPKAAVSLCSRGLQPPPDLLVYCRSATLCIAGSPRGSGRGKTRALRHRVHRASLQVGRRRLYDSSSAAVRCPE